MTSLTVFLSAQLKNMSKDPAPKEEEEKEKEQKPADAKKNDCRVCCNKAFLHSILYQSITIIH